MAINTYDSVLADVAFGLNIFATFDRIDAELVYNRAVGGALVPTDADSSDFVLNQIRQAILDTELEIIHQIGLNPNHPERGDFEAVSDPLTSGDPLPTLSADSKEFHGPFDSLTDISTGFLMNRREFPLVRMAVRNSNSAWSVPTRPLVWCVSG